MSASPMNLLTLLTLSALTSIVALTPTARHISKGKGSLQDLGDADNLIRSDHLAYVVGSGGQLAELTQDEEGALHEQSEYQAPVEAAEPPQEAPVSLAVVPPAAVELPEVASADAAPDVDVHRKYHPPVMAPAVKPAVVAPAANPLLQALVVPVPVDAAVDAVQPSVVAQPAAVPATVPPAPTAAPEDEGRGFLGYVFLVVGVLMCTFGLASVVIYIGVKHFGLSEHKHYQSLQEAVGNASADIVSRTSSNRASQVPSRMQEAVSTPVTATPSEASLMWKTSKERQTYRRSVLSTHAHSDTDEDDDTKAGAGTGGSTDKVLLEA